MTIALKAEEHLSSCRETKHKIRRMLNKNNHIHCLSPTITTEQDQKSSPFRTDSLAPVSSYELFA